jgi:hypothetical protein
VLKETEKVIHYKLIFFLGKHLKSRAKSIDNDYKGVTETVTVTFPPLPISFKPPRPSELVSY